MQNRPRWEREDRDSRIDRNRQSKRLVFRRSLFLMLVCGVGLFITNIVCLLHLFVMIRDTYILWLIVCQNTAVVKQVFRCQPIRCNSSAPYL